MKAGSKWLRLHQYLLDSTSFSRQAIYDLTNTRYPTEIQKCIVRTCHRWWPWCYSLTLVLPFSLSLCSLEADRTSTALNATVSVWPLVDDAISTRRLVTLAIPAQSRRPQGKPVSSWMDTHLLLLKVRSSLWQISHGEIKLTCFNVFSSLRSLTFRNK